ncbi:MAG: GNAT family N-acetyltransferase [Candidatus Colwellbacteria bacterium]|nr:GNAT family N-acetyltransferase [Candidatus Colwellbacteria bacterium]
MFIGENNLFSHSEVIEGIVNIYQQAFGGDPWNEGYVCPVCEGVFALKDGIEKCPTCAEKSRSVLLVEYWPKSKVISDYYREMMKMGSLCIIAGEGDVPFGFAWGYKVTTSPELDQALDAPGLHTIIEGNFFYLDECAVIPSHQGKGIGKLLMHRVVLARPRVLLRTMDGSKMYRLVLHMGGKMVQHISRGRVIMSIGA